MDRESSEAWVSPGLKVVTSGPCGCGPWSQGDGVGPNFHCPPTPVNWGRMGVGPMVKWKVQKGQHMATHPVKLKGPVCYPALWVPGGRGGGRPCSL